MTEFKDRAFDILAISCLPLALIVSLGCWMYWGPGLSVVYPEKHAASVYYLSKFPPTSDKIHGNLSLSDVLHLTDEAVDWACGLHESTYENC